MLRVFTEEERSKMGEVKSKDLEYLYPNKAFIMINTRNHYEHVSGRKCISGLIGTLYAMFDYEDMHRFADIVNEASDIEGVDCIATFSNFPVRGGMYYVGY